MDGEAEPAAGRRVVDDEAAGMVDEGRMVGVLEKVVAR
jgi:hypothetical protein